MGLVVDVLMMDDDESVEIPRLKGVFRGDNITDEDNKSGKDDERWRWLRNV